jgi:hypothetical protein
MIERNFTTLTLYNTLESESLINAINTRMEVLSVVPTLQAALEYTALKQLCVRMLKAETVEVSSEHH